MGATKVSQGELPQTFLDELKALLLERENAQRIEQQERENAQRIEQQVQLEYLVQKLTQTNIISSPTVATLGRQAHNDLVRVGRWHLVEKSGEAVLDDSQCLELAALECTDESALIHWFTPHLQRVVARASDKTGKPLMLLNTERHPWVDDPHRGAKSKPDMLVAHPALCKLNKTDGDAKYDGDGFWFGECAHFDLRDSVTAIMEWKVQMGSNEFKALGEGIEYARRLSHVNSQHSTISADDVSITRVVLADREGFQLLTCLSGHAESCVVGCWSDPGSMGALVSFLTPEEPCWLEALHKICEQFQLQPKDCCFLGRGGTGRVFSVIEEGGRKLAVKVALCDIGCTMLAAEKASLENPKLEPLGFTVSSRGWFMDAQRRFAGLLLHPVGEKLPMTKQAISSAINALVELAHAGLCHGDARLPNVAWVDGESALWLDLRTLSETTNPGASCTQDIITFATSLGLEDAINLHFNKEGPLELCKQPSGDLLSVFQRAWQKTNSNGLLHQ